MQKTFVQMLSAPEIKDLSQGKASQGVQLQTLHLLVIWNLRDRTHLIYYYILYRHRLLGP